MLLASTLNTKAVTGELAESLAVIVAGTVNSTENMPPFLTAACLIRMGANSGLDGGKEEGAAA